MGNLELDEAYWKNKRVLITGHTGFKGSWLADWLLQYGAKVTGLSLEPVSKPNHFDLLKLEMDSHFVDIRDEAKLASTIKAIRPEVIFHLAAQSLVRDSYHDPLATFNTNVLGTANILQASRAVEDLKAVLVITSDKCYENKEWNFAYRENDEMGGYDPYSASKGCAELVAASFRNSFFNVEEYGTQHQTLIATARAGNVIGGGDWAKDRLMPDLFRAIGARETVHIRNPQAVRPWQHVLDCLSGYLCLAQELMQGEKQFAQAWNFGPSYQSVISVLDAVKCIKKHWSSLQYEIDSSPALHEAQLLVLDSTKANRFLKWHNCLDFSDAIAWTVEWYRDYFENKKIITNAQIQRYIKVATT